MIGTIRFTLLASCAALALMSAGCGNSRPAGVATEPGDAYVELSDLQIEQVGDEIRLRVTYRFPDGSPHPDAWFSCSFEINGGANGTVTSRKQARELEDAGTFEATTYAKFLRQKTGTLGAYVRQAKAKSGPYHDVSAKLLVDF